MSFKRYQDNLDFLEQFRKNLMDLGVKDIRDLVTRGQFNALGHNVADNSMDCDDCDNCYSGDTEYEMGNGSDVLGRVWMQTANDLGLSTHKYPKRLYDEDVDDAENDENDEDDEDDEMLKMTRMWMNNLT